MLQDLYYAATEKVITEMAALFNAMKAASRKIKEDSENLRLNVHVKRAIYFGFTLGSSTKVSAL